MNEKNIKDQDDSNSDIYSSNKYVISPSSSSSLEMDFSCLSDSNQICLIHCPPPNITLYGDIAINRFRKEEKNRILDPNFRINVQKDIEEPDRNNLVLWMLSTCSKLKVSDASIFLAVKIFDYLLSKIEISRNNLEIYAPCALLIAIKFEDIEHMQILERLCPLSLNVHDQELRDLEIYLFKIIDYNAIFSTVFIFLMYYIDKTQTTERDKFYNIARFFAFSSISTDRCIFNFDSETIAISCVFLTTLVLKENNSFMKEFSNFSSLKECTDIILNAARNIFFYKNSEEFKLDYYYLAVSDELIDFLDVNHIRNENGNFVNIVFDNL